jgi:hypothetical protein
MKTAVVGIIAGCLSLLSPLASGQVRSSTPAQTISFQAVSATQIFVLGSDEKLWLELAPFGAVPPKRKQVDVGVRSFQALGAGSTFVLRTDGTLWRETGPFGPSTTRVEVDGQVQSFQALSATQALVLGSDGKLWLEQAPFGTVPPARIEVDGSVQGFQAMSATEVYVVGTDGKLWLEQAPFGTVPPARAQVDGSVQAFQALSTTEAVVLGTNGKLWLEQAPWGTVPPSRAQVDGTVQAFNALSSSQIYALGTNGKLWLEQAPFGTVPPSRSQVDGQVQFFQPLSSTQAVVLGTDTKLWLEQAPWGTVPPSRVEVDASLAKGHQGLMIETANSYTSCFGPGNDLTNSNQSGTNFLNQINTTNAMAFSLVGQRQDSNTSDIDFLDPDTSGANSLDDDTAGFDQPGLAISYYQAHGLASIKPIPDQVCTTKTQCTSPPSGASGNGLCVVTPSSVAKYGTGQGVCQYSSTRSLAVCGSKDANGHIASLSPNMALGENPYNGAWRGAGTNGGTSLAIVHMSFGMMTFFPSEWFDLFAGLHIYEGMMISWGDTNDSLGYGNAVASPYTVNPYSSVSQGYVNAISSVTDGGGCSGATSWGGGFNGCGCHVAMSLSTNKTGAQAALNESWFDLKFNWAYQNGSGYYWATWNCNYNPNTYPWGN